jgi:hypothetical protein
MMRTLAITGLVILLAAMSDLSRAQWVPTNETTSESITSLAVSGSKLFAGTGSRFGGNGEGVFLSSDSGTSWTAVSAGLKYDFYTGDVICLTETETGIFAGTDSGVFRSTDNGTSWSAWSAGLPPDCYVTSIATIGTNVFAAAAGGGSTQEIFLSTDNGTSWTAIYSGLHGVSAWALAVSTNIAGDSNIFAGTDKGIFLSTNNGASWAEMNDGLTDSTTILSLAVSITNTSPPMLFAGTLGSGVFSSSNNGTKWIAANSGLPANAAVNAFWVNGTNLFAGTLDSGVFLSTNNGTSWQDVSTGLTDTTIMALAVSGTNLYAGTGNSGVWRRPLSDFGISAVAQTLTTQSQIQSYPNPLSSQATITFTNENDGYAEVTIVNLLGSQVAQLFTGELTAGEHSFSWDASGMAPGMYECVVNVGGQTQRVSLVHLQ